MVVAFVGVSGSGKDYRKELLMGDGYVSIDFKDSLLDMASDLVGFNVRENYDLFKENIVGLTVPDLRPYGGCIKYPPHTVTKEVLAQYPHAMTGRVLLQRLGTEVMRKRDPDYWVDQWMNKVGLALAEGKNVACADCRFPNEMAAVREWREHRFVFCDYHSPRYNAFMNHESERMAQGYLGFGCKDGDDIGEIDAIRASEEKKHE